MRKFTHFSPVFMDFGIRQNIDIDNKLCNLIAACDRTAIFVCNFIVSFLAYFTNLRDVWNDFVESITSTYSYIKSIAFLNIQKNHNDSKLLGLVNQSICRFV